MLRQSVLIISDKEDPRDYEERLQREVGCCNVIKGLDTIKECVTDLVILDCGLETNHCIHLLEKIKQSYPGLPVILVTDESSEDVAIKAFKRGARDYFKTPVDMDELRKTVDAVLRFKQQAPDKLPTPLTLSAEHVEEMPHPYADIPEKLERAVSFIQRNLTRPISLDRIAQEACTSKYHFCRLFKQHFDVSPMQYVINLRINRAVTLLESKDLPISVVAMRAGFNDLTEFNRQFRKRTGLSPSLFRKHITEKNNPPSPNSKIPPIDSNFPKAH